MILWCKSELWFGARVELSDGRHATTEENTDNHETVMVLIDGDEDTTEVYVGETCDGSLYAKLLLPGQSEDPPQDTPEPVDPLDDIFDGIDPLTFDGDILDLI